MSAILKVSYLSKSVDFNKIYDLLVGEIFYYTEDIESLYIRVQADKPITKTTFTIVTVTPGTELFTLYGECLVVTQNVDAPTGD